MESNIIEKLINKNLLTVKENKVCLKPHEQRSFTTYPIKDEDYILVTFDEYIGLITGVYMFSEDLTTVVDYEEIGE